MIREFVDGARECAKVDMPIDLVPELMGPLDGIKAMAKMLPFMRISNKWGKISLGEYSQRFSNPLLRRVISELWMPEMPVLLMLWTLAFLDHKMAGYPIGGSLEFARGLERRYLDLGGEVHYKARVTEILVENDRAIGVRLEDGTEVRSDYVVSAADGHATIFDMLDGRYVDDKIRGYYQRLPLFEPIVYVAVGVNRSFSDFPASTTGLVYPLDPPVPRRQGDAGLRNPRLQLRSDPRASGQDRGPDHDSLGLRLLGEAAR